LLSEDLILIFPFSCNETVERKRGKNIIRMAACIIYFLLSQFYGMVSYDLPCSVWGCFVLFERMGGNGADEVASLRRYRQTPRKAQIIPSIET
jgi:hypothetical protein